MKHSTTRIKHPSCVLTSFDLYEVENYIVLNWTVSSDMHLYYFVLERSADFQNWKTIEIRKGNCSGQAAPEFFSFIDLYEKPGDVAYRLLAVQPVRSGNELLLYSDGVNLFEGNPRATILVKRSESKRYINNN